MLPAGLTGHAQPYNFYNLFIDKGLSSPQVTAIVQDQYGFMWFGTPNGLNRYDGYSIKTFYAGGQPGSLPSNSILSLFSTSKGELWVGTANGAVRYNFTGESFAYVDTANAAAVGITRSPVYTFAEDAAGNLYLGCANALFTYNHTAGYRNISKQVNQAVRMRNIRRMRFLPNNMLYMVTNGNLPFFALNTKTGAVDSIHYKTEFADTCCLNMFGLETLNDHELLTGFLSYGIARLDASNKKYLTVPGELGKNPNILYNSVYDILRDHQGRVWVASYYYRLAQYLPGVNRIVTYEKDLSNPLAFDGNNATCLYEDRRHNIWVGTSGKGVYHFNPDQNATKFYPEHDYLPGMLQTGRVTCLSIIDSNTWLAGTEAGPSLYDRRTGRFTNYKGIAVNGIDAPVEQVHCAYTAPDGIIWMGTNRLGLMRFDPRTKTFKCFSRVTQPFKLTDDGIADIEPMPNNEAMLLGFGRPVIFNLKTWFSRSFRTDSTNPVLKLTNITDISKGPDGLLWLCGAGGQLFTYEPLTQKLINRAAMLAALPEKPGINKIEWDKTTIYLATTDGIIRIDAAGKLRQHKMPEPGNALAEVRGLLYNKGYIWFGNNRLAGRLEPNSGQLFFLGEKEGLINMQLFSNTLTKTPQGSILLGTNRGFYEIFPERMNTVKNVLPPARLTAFRVFEHPFKLGEMISTAQNIDLNYDQNFFSFDISAFAYDESEDIEYAYLLQGFDKDWQYLGKKRSASYTNVPGGDYVLKLKARNSSGEWNESGQEVKLHISKPFTGTWLFRLLMLAAAAGIIWLIYQNRIRNINKEARLRSDYEIRLNELENSALRTQMNPHFIFNSLNTINSFINSNDRVQANQYISKFSRLVRLILDHSREKRILLDDELEVAALYMQLEQIRFENKFSYDIDVQDVDASATEVPPLIIQPFVENAILHGLLPKGPGGKLQITIAQKNKLLECSIEDNGIGRGAAKKIRDRSGFNRKSHGLEITLKRIELFNKEAGITAPVVITDLLDAAGEPAGTRVVIGVAYVDSY